MLVDSNIFMYAAGREYPLKQRAAAFLERLQRIGGGGDHC